MSLDPVKNFAKVEVSTGYDASATSIVLVAGHGAKLPQPSTDGEFNLVWWNSTDYPDPADDPNVEIVRCTARSTDTLTVTRNQEDSGASVKNIADKTYKMVLGITKKMKDDLPEVVTVASDVLEHSNDAQKGTDSTTYVKLKEIKCNKNYETLRIKFAMVSYGETRNAYGRIYKNGVAIGTERNNTTSDWVIYSEDLGPFVRDDLVQLYAKQPTPSCQVKDMRLYFSMSIPSDFTDQDPA